PSNINDCNESRYFQCQNGMCIPKVARCNDMPDCQEGEDEENCDYLYESNESIEQSSTEEPTTTQAENLTTTTTTTMRTTIATSTTKMTTEAPSTTTAGKFLPPFPRADTSWIPSRFDVLQKSIHHLIEQRDALWGWGRSTPRMVTALYLANSSYFDRDNYEGLLTKKQLEVQLALDLMRYGLCIFFLLQNVLLH
ncbi:uncharacterized protein TNIN_240101, partial [Trichonephila inaurata madagascariensis]